MGMNFYLHDKPACQCCNRPYEPLHIGKSSFGWCFALHVIPELGVNDLKDWEKLWSIPGAIIEDELGSKIFPREMRIRITDRRGTLDGVSKAQNVVGYTSYQDEMEFHKFNNSMRGPNNLFRSVIDGRCIKHGSGTWDCIVGKFS